MPQAHRRLTPAKAKDAVVQVYLKEAESRLAKTPYEMFRPQPGPQTMARESDADIVIMGGAAFGGKTWSLLTDPLDQIHVGGFRVAMFRRLTTALSMPGGLAEEADKIYPKVGGIPRDRGHRWFFPSGAKISMHHMQFLSDARAWELGAQLTRACFDQLEEFEAEMFWIIVGRMRTATRIKTKLFGTCNPVPADDPIGGWLNTLLQWWWDPDTGYAIPGRSGVKRWFYRALDQIYWYDSRRAAIEAHPDLYEETTKSGEKRYNEPMSLCFIAAGIDDNVIGEKLDPTYRGKLNALTEVKKERMKRGNWLARDESGSLINTSCFADRQIDPHEVPELERIVRGWDKASTRRAKANPKHSKTASGKLGVHRPGGGMADQYYILDGSGDYMEMVERERTIQATAEADGKGVFQVVELEPAGAGKDSGRITMGKIAAAGLGGKLVPGKGEDKLTKCLPFATDCNAGNVWMVRGPHAGPMLAAFRAFDGKQPGSDETEACALAHGELQGGFKPWFGK